MRFILYIVLLFINVIPVRLFATSDPESHDTIPFRQITLTTKSKSDIRISETYALLQVEALNEHKKGIEGVPIFLKNIGPGKIDISPGYILSDSAGKANINISNFKKKGKYKILCYTDNTKFQSEPLYFELNVRATNWIFIMFIGLLGGLSLFLFGMSLMNNGIQGSAGNNIRKILKKLTNNRFVAVGIGVLITTIVQSSSATNVMLVSFVDSQLMRFKQTIGIILGAAIGTTITVQIIAFKLTDYALVFVSIGLGLHFISKNYKLSELGKVVLGFGILFFGMHTMSEAMVPLRTYQPILDIIIKLERPFIGILVGTLLTALIQSSGAFIGILIILSMQGLLSLNAAISLIIGANIGTAITALLASINAIREAKQVAFAHTFIKIIGATLALLFIPSFTQFIQFLDPDGANDIATPRQIANAHTIYNIVLCLVFIPFTNSVAWIINKIYPVGEKKEETNTVKFIDYNLLVAPSIAIEAAQKEVIRLMKEVAKMTGQIIEPFFNKKTKISDSIILSEVKVKFLRDNINEFLVRLSRSDVSDDSIEEAFILMNAVREFEHISDIVANKLLQKAEFWCNEDFKFSDSGKEELMKYHQNTKNIIRKAIKVYQTLDLKKAIKLKDKYYIYREEYFEFERQHYDRLKQNVEETVTSSKTHLELITLLRVISSHATNTARIIIYRTSKTQDKEKEKKKKKKKNK